MIMHDDDDVVVLLPPALRVPPGGNQVDGLPPASLYARKLRCAQVGLRTNLMQTCFQIAISQRLGHLRTFPLANLGSIT